MCYLVKLKHFVSNKIFNKKLCGWFIMFPIQKTTRQNNLKLLHNINPFNHDNFSGCKKSADPAGAGSTVTEPSNYLGPPASGTWTSSFDGQKGRYCNFQDTTYIYTRTDVSQITHILQLPENFSYFIQTLDFYRLPRWCKSQYSMNWKSNRTIWSFSPMELKLRGIEN